MQIHDGLNGVDIFAARSNLDVYLIRQLYPELTQINDRMIRGLLRGIEDYPEEGIPTLHENPFWLLVRRFILVEVEKSVKDVGWSFERQPFAQDVHHELSIVLKAINYWETQFHSNYRSGWQSFRRAVLPLRGQPNFFGRVVDLATDVAFGVRR